MRWLLYGVAPVVALLAILAVWGVLLPACAVTSQPWARWLPHSCAVADLTGDRGDLAFETRRRRALEAEMRLLERELLELAACEAPGRAGAPSRAVPDQPTAPSRGVPDQPTDPTIMDEDRWAARDISMLDGCWLLDSDYELVERRTGNVLSVELWRACFDDTGAGRQEFRLSNGLVCNGGIAAGFAADGSLTLSDTDHVPCDTGDFISRRSGRCELDAARQATCVLEDNAGRSRVTLRRDG